MIKAYHIPDVYSGILYDPLKNNYYLLIDEKVCFIFNLIINCLLIGKGEASKFRHVLFIHH